MLNFKAFIRVKDTGNVIIHPNIKYGHIELTGEFVDKLEKHLTKSIWMAKGGIEELSPTDKLAIMLLEGAY